MSLPMWMLWRALAALGEAITHIATVAAWIAVAAGLLALCTHLGVHLVGPTRWTALRGWITWRWHRRTARRFAHAVATGDPETAEAHARQLLAPTHPRRAARPTAGTGGDEQDRRHNHSRRPSAN
jgi:hypothetical protein